MLLLRLVSHQTFSVVVQLVLGKSRSMVNDGQEKSLKHATIIFMSLPIQLRTIDLKSRSDRQVIKAVTRLARVAAEPPHLPYRPDVERRRPAEQIRQVALIGTKETGIVLLNAKS